MGRMERSIMNIIAANKLMFYTIVLILFCKYVFANENGDLSGTTYPTENVKVLEVLDKIEQVEKEGDKVYWNKITTVNQRMRLINTVMLK